MDKSILKQLAISLRIWLLISLWQGSIKKTLREQSTLKTMTWRCWKTKSTLMKTISNLTVIESKVISKQMTSRYDTKGTRASRSLLIVRRASRRTSRLAIIYRPKHPLSSSALRIRIWLKETCPWTITSTIAEGTNRWLLVNILLLVGLSRNMKSTASEPRKKTNQARNSLLKPGLSPRHKLHLKTTWLPIRPVPTAPLWSWQSRRQRMSTLTFKRIALAILKVICSHVLGRLLICKCL